MTATPQGTATTHTPGPWWNDHGTIRTVERSDMFQKGRKLATCFLGPVSDHEHLANATLMATAPDLLAALKTINDWCGTGDGYHALPFEPPWNQQMLAAIARAEGRQP